jgi:hypothetical protein
MVTNTKTSIDVHFQVRLVVQPRQVINVDPSCADNH